MDKGIEYTLRRKIERKLRDQDEEVQIRLALKHERPEVLKLRKEAELGCPVYFRT